jgi:hypothetical protein
VHQDLIERVRRTRRLRIGAALVLAALGVALALACASDSRESAVLSAAASRYVPVSTVALRDGRRNLHEPQFVLQAAPNELTVIERGTQDLWTLPLVAGGTPRRVTALRGKGRTRIVAAAARDGVLAMLDLTGRIWFYRTGDVFPFSHWRIAVPKGTAALALLAATDSTWLVAEQHSITDTATRTLRDSALVVSVAPDGTQRLAWGFERAGPRRPGAFFTDYVAASSFSDTIVVTAADPPRIMTWWRGDPTARRLTKLTGARERVMAPPDRALLANAAASARSPLAHGAILRAYYPPIAGARSDGQGWFVIAGAGSHTFALDYYCRGAFR